MKQNKKYPIYGIMAEFESPAAILKAAQSAHAAGYRVMDAYTPFPIEEVSEAIGFHRRDNKVALTTLIGGLLGGLGGYTLASSAAGVWFPLNIAGRPFNPWPMFIPVTFESTVLIAGLSAAIGMIIMNGLPSPYHPVFNVPGFSQVTNNKFFLCIESRDPKYDEAAVMDFMNSLDPVEVTRVQG